jgi:hypothetical protein
MNTTTSVQITKPVHRNILDLFKGITIEQVEAYPYEDAIAAWQKVGGPLSNRNFLTQPDGSAKSRKSVIPEYMLYMLPHKLAGQSNLCKWSVKGCRDNCLVTAGRGMSPVVWKGRLARTLLMFANPVAFLKLISKGLDSVEKKGGWVRLNGTSDIPWEHIMGGALIKDRKIIFADYTKASIAQRPDPEMDNYRLSRSVWPGKHDAESIADLLKAGERVSMVVADPYAFEGIEGVAMADKTDEWIMGKVSALGLLGPKGKLLKDPDNYYTNSVVEEVLEILNG